MNDNLALAYVLKLLAIRDYSEYELRCKMQAKNFSAQEIEEVIAKCQARNWQSDLRFCEHFLLSRVQKGYGLQRIKQEMQQKGIQNEVLQHVLAQNEIDWFALAKQVLCKKYPDYAEEKELKTKQKMWRYLYSRGFTQEEISALFKEYD
ncbi:recombinase RecX [Gallibacterium salpingitidis]|uniref:Regulatory protein RecX n=1 Tax=Gallibacterium salpingitidis TaxID=505341 RepID=A0AB36E4P2_9PAST|nr:recombination regulator RecX [Gallibacterium salpingitidis]OBX08250.1 recombinase RecX [Gallibacterium salpingitidis]OBX08672.1 recombinase RecX [Gallibacterium salpingitidis]WKS99315.1 recombination regulator RecX [Gallibacterium salpingitidis]